MIFDPWSKRNSDPEPRIHQNLTPNARKRIAHTLEFVDQNDIDRAYDELVELTGKDPDVFNHSHSRNEAQYEFITNHEDQDVVIDYLELLINVVWRTEVEKRYTTENKYSEDKLIERCAKIEKALIENGVLIQMSPSPSEEMITDDWSRVYDYDKIIFKQLSDETIIESDQELRVLALGDEWKEPLEAYNEAWQLYKDDTFTYVVAEKLYNSLEAVCKEICIEKEGWLEEGATVGDCLDELREKGLFKPNDEMVAEWTQIAKGIQIGVQRTGGDRKRHEQIDQDYLILILHQISSFLTFVIKQYEKAEFQDGG